MVWEMVIATQIYFWRETSAIETKNKKSRFFLFQTGQFIEK